MGFRGGGSGGVWSLIIIKYKCNYRCRFKYFQQQQKANDIEAVARVKKLKLQRMSNLSAKQEPRSRFRRPLKPRVRDGACAHDSVHECVR